MKIVFVCTGNIFRSVSAEFSLKEYLKKNKIRGITVKSGGIIAKPQVTPKSILDPFEILEFDHSKHKQKKVTKDYLKNFDLIVSMASNHKKFIKEKFNIKSVLFNKICYNKNSSIKDITETKLSIRSNPKKSSEYISKTINHIHDSIPRFFRNYKKFLK
jgi:protein-tyrosine-phosphatase